MHIHLKTPRNYLMMQQAVLLLFGILYSCQGLPEPVGYYPLSSATAANDSSIFKNPPGIIVHASIAQGVYGEVNGSLSFSGARSPPSYVHLPKSSVLDTRISISLLAWVFPEGSGGEIISYWQDSNYGVFISLENHRPVFHVYSRDQTTKYSLASGKKLLPNQWNHIVGTYDNITGVAKVYVNGSQVANKTGLGQLNLKTEYGLWLGYLFKGRLSQVWVFNVSLSEAEVNQAMDFTKPLLSSSSPSSTHVFSTSSIIPSTTVDVTSTSTIATISATPRTTSSASSQSLPPPSQPFQAPTSSQTPIDATSTAKPTLTYTTSTATQMLSRATSTVNQTLSHAAPTVNQTAVLSTTRTTPQNVEVTMTQVTITSVMNTQSINASSVTIPLLPVSPAPLLLKCYHCSGPEDECNDEIVANNSSAQTVCSQDQDKCVWFYDRFNNSQEQVRMNCTSTYTCKRNIESCMEAMKTKATECCNVICCDSNFCNKPEYTGGKTCIRKPALVAIIDGGAEVIRGLNENKTTNGSLSYDPDVGPGNHSGMNFTWRFGEIKGNYSLEQLSNKDQFIGPENSIIEFIGNEVHGLEVTFYPTHLNLSENKIYVVKLEVTKDYRNSSVYQVIRFVKGQPPKMSQRCLINCGLKISPSVKLSVQSECQGSQCDKIDSYEWVLHQQNQSAVEADIVWRKREDLQHIASTPLNSNDIVIKENSLEGGEIYRLVLYVQTTDGLPGMCAHDISAALPPSCGTCTITPSSGISLKTDFNLTCSNWTSDVTPLTYQFRYQLGNGLYSVIYHGVNNSIISWLPPGNQSDNSRVKFVVTVTDKYGASAPDVNLTVQVEPSELLNPENLTSFLTAKDSLFNQVLKGGDLNKAAQIANTLLQATSQYFTLTLAEKSEIQEFIVKSIVGLQVDSIPDLLQTSSVIGSAIQDTQTVSAKSLEYALPAIDDMTSLLWNIAQSKDVADIPLITQSAENLGSCLNSVLKAGAVIASGMFGTGLQEEGKNLVTDSVKIIGTVADAVLAIKVPDEAMTSIKTTELALTLGRHTPAKLVGLKIEGGDSRFVLPVEKETLESSIKGTSFVDTQMLSIPFNPFTWDNTRERVDSDVLALDLKDNARSLIKVSNLTEDVVIVTSLKPQQVSLQNPQYFTQNDNLRFHQIDVEYENTMIMLEITPSEASTSLFVYLQYGQRPTTQEHDLNATVSKLETCIWTSAHDKTGGKTKCSLNGLKPVPIETVARQSGRYFVGVQSYNTSVSALKRRKRSCFGKKRQKRSCVQVKDPPPTPPQSENITVVPGYDPNTAKNYTLRVALGSCVYWSDELEKWTTDGCRVLSATLNGLLNCACNHLTSFGGSLFVKPNPIDFDKVLVEFKRLGETGNVSVIVTVAVVVLCYIVVLVIVRKADKEDARNNGLPVQLPTASNNLHEYEIIITTGVWRGSGTTANVAMEIYGADESTGIIQLGRGEPGAESSLFSRGNTDIFVLKLDKPLGVIQGVRIGHDNYGDSPSWFLEEIVVLDKETNRSWTFTNSQWLALERGDGRIERLMEATNQTDFDKEVVKRWWRGLTENHIWISVIAKPRRNHFTRVQRASCCLSVLLTAMLANAMFYQLDGKSEQVIQIGPLKFSWRQVIIGIESALIVAPINILIAFLFRKGAERNVEDTAHCCSKTRWLTYAAWVIFFCSCAVSAIFTIFYSLIWGKSISEQWLSSMLISFTQDIAVTEPVKVFFTALFLAAIIRKKRSKSSGYECLEEAKKSSAKGRLWEMKLSEVEKMRRRQARKENISRFFVELFVYLIFVFLLLVVCYGNRNDHRYMMTKSIRDGIPNFDTVFTNKKYWSWMTDVFLPGAFAGTWYNNQRENQTIYIGNKRSVLVGMPRARQLRVKPKSCDVLDYMKHATVCYGSYSSTSESKTPFNQPGWKPADNSTNEDELFRLCPKPWRYQDPEETDTFPKWGQFSFYPGGGFVADLGYENTTGFSIIKELQKDSWLDRQTRGVILEFSEFNPSSNLLGIGAYFYEIESSGYRGPFTRTEIVSLDSTETGSRQFYLICRLLFIIFVTFYLGRECYRLQKQRSRYFKSFWSWVEIFQVIFSVLAVVLYIVRSEKAVSTVQELQKNIYSNVSFQEVIIWLEVENAVLGILTFIITAKLLRLIRFNEHVAVFSRTLKTSARLLSSFSVVLLICFMAFLHFGVLTFGSGSPKYSSILRAVYFQLELTLGRVKARSINELADANDTFGRIFSALLLLSLTIVSMNFFIATMNDALINAKTTTYESELSDLVDGNCNLGREENKDLFDAISKSLGQMKIENSKDKERQEDIANVVVTSTKPTIVDFDLISKAIIASRVQNVENSNSSDEEPTASNTSSRRKSFFDLVSGFIGKRKLASKDLNDKRKTRSFSGRNKVRFSEDVVKSQLKRLRKQKGHLFQRLDDILQEHSDEEEKFHLLCHEMGVFSQSTAKNVTGSANESLA